MTEKTIGYITTNKQKVITGTGFYATECGKKFLVAPNENSITNRLFPYVGIQWPVENSARHTYFWSDGKSLHNVYTITSKWEDRPAPPKVEAIRYAAFFDDWRIGDKFFYDPEELKKYYKEKNIPIIDIIKFKGKNWKPKV